jgi:hypothetical protein
LKVQTFELIAEISEDGSLINFAIQQRAVVFVCEIAEKLAGDNFALFLEILSVYWDAKLLFEDFNINGIFKVPHCPQFNGIESQFSQGKAT